MTRSWTCLCWSITCCVHRSLLYYKVTEPIITSWSTSQSNITITSITLSSTSRSKANTLSADIPSSNTSNRLITHITPNGHSQSAPTTSLSLPAACPNTLEAQPHRLVWLTNPTFFFFFVLVCCRLWSRGGASNNGRPMTDVAVETAYCECSPFKTWICHLGHYEKISTVKKRFN